MPHKYNADRTLPVIRPVSVPRGPLHVPIDRAGLRVYGAGQLLETRHGAKSRRTWHKLHLAADAASGIIVAQTLADQDADDPSQVGPLLDRIDDSIGQVIADGPYDGAPAYQTIAQHVAGPNRMLAARWRERDAICSPRRCLTVQSERAR
jgi:hypothetical protein